MAKSSVMTCAFTVDDVRAQHRRTLVSLGRYRRLSDYVTSALLFLQANVLLRGELTEGDLRRVLPDSWFGTPAMGVLYAHLNRLHRDHAEQMLLVTSMPMAPIAHLANLWIEGGTAARYGANGGGLLHLAEKLDEALATFAGCVRDDATADAALAQALLAVDKVAGTVVCAVDVSRGTSRYLDGAAPLMRTSRGVVLPILLQQGRLGATPGYAAMDDDERTAVLQEMGYAVRTVEIGLQFEARLYTTLEWAWHTAHGEPLAEESASTGHPLIVLKIPRSLTMPASLASQLDRSPASFLDALRGEVDLLEMFRNWLDGYLPDELVETDGCPDKDILALCAAGEERLARMRCGLT